MTEVPIIRWADGAVLRRRGNSRGDRFAKFALDFSGQIDSVVFTLVLPQDPSTWPTMAGSSAYFWPTIGRSQAQVTTGQQLRRTHDALSALGLLRRAETREVTGPGDQVVLGHAGPGHLTVYPDAEPDAPPWAWASADVDGTVHVLADAPPPGLLRWRDLLERVGAVQ